MNLEKTNNDIPMEHEHHIEHEDDDHIEWSVCCSKSSKSFIKYITTVLMSITILLFCIFMIASNPKQDNSIYFSLLSSILTLYIPAPTLDKSN